MARAHTRVVLALLAGVAVAALGLAGPTPAFAGGVKTYTGRIGPIKLAGFGVAYDTATIKGPKMDGSITGMRAVVVDRRGRSIPVNRVMLHHVLFEDAGRRDGERHDGACPSIPRERVYGTGEEHQVLRLPQGYGIPVHRGDRWQAAWMLMDHRIRRETAYIKYRIQLDVEHPLTPTKAYWLSVTGCRTPVYNVAGGGDAGSTDSRAYTWTVPANGRIVAAGAHLHGGATSMRLLQQRCGNRELVRSRAVYGTPDDLVYRTRPVLHEPGPINTSWFTSAQGIPLEKGERVTVADQYDNEFPHPRVMAIDHVYMATGDGVQSTPCAPLPGDAENLNSRIGRSAPPHVTVPLTAIGRDGRAHTIDRAPGALRTLQGPATVDVFNFAFRPANLSIPLGARLTWVFSDHVRHNVTLANGPEGFGSLSLRSGTFTHRFTRPGTYQLYCTLHPVAMQQVVDVRPP